MHTPRDSEEIPERGQASRSAQPRAYPTALAALVALVVLESFSLVVGMIVIVVELLRGGSGSSGVSVFLIAFAFVVALALAGSARALARRRRWGRAPVATWQVLQLVVAVTASSEAVVARVVVGAVALGVLVLLVVPPVVAWTTGKRAA